jgi:trimeric autotransporter adhesin
MMAVVVPLRRRLAAVAAILTVTLVAAVVTTSFVYAFESSPSSRAATAKKAATGSAAAAAAARRHHHHHHHHGSSSTISLVALHAMSDRIDGFALMRQNFKTVLVPNNGGGAASSSFASSSAAASTDTAFQQAYANVLSTTSDAAATATSSASASASASSSSSSTSEAVTSAMAKTASSAASSLADSMERLQRELMAIVPSDTSSSSKFDFDFGAMNNMAVPSGAGNKFAAEVAKASSSATTNMDSLMRSIQSIKVDTLAFSVPASSSSSSSSLSKTIPTFAEYLTAQGINVNNVLSSTHDNSQNWLAQTENGQKLSTLLHEMTDTLLHPTAIADSAQAFGDSLVNIAHVLQQDAWSSQDLNRALNVAETGNWYLATGAFLAFMIGATATNSIEEAYKYQKHDYLIQSYLQETNDASTTKGGASSAGDANNKNAAELMAVQNQVEQLTQATAAVADFMVQLQKDKAAKDVDLASLKLELRNLSSQLMSTKSVESDLRESLQSTQKELKVQSSSLQKDLEQRARAEHALQTKLAATEKNLEAERARVLAAKEAAAEREKREREEIKLRSKTMSGAAAAAAAAMAAAAADNDAMAMNNEILAALSTEKDSMIAQVETIQREMQNLRELLKNQAARQQSAAAALKAAATAKASSSIKTASPPQSPPPAAAAAAAVALVKEEKKEEPAKPSPPAATSTASVRSAYFSAAVETKKTPKTTTTTTSAATPTSSTKKKTTTTTLAAAKAEPEPAPAPAPATVVVPPKKQAAVKGSSSSPPEPVAATTTTPPVVTEPIIKSTKTNKKKETSKAAAAAAAAPPVSTTSKTKTITIKKAAAAPKQAEPKMKATAATVVADTAAKDGGEGGDDEDWSRLAASTLKRKTTKDLISYLESRVRVVIFSAFVVLFSKHAGGDVKSYTRCVFFYNSFFCRGPVQRDRMAKYSKRISW